MLKLSRSPLTRRLFSHRPPLRPAGVTRAPDARLPALADDGP